MRWQFRYPGDRPKVFELDYAWVAFPSPTKVRMRFWPTAISYDRSKKHGLVFIGDISRYQLTRMVFDQVPQLNLPSSSWSGSHDRRHLRQPEAQLRPLRRLRRRRRLRGLRRRSRRGAAEEEIQRLRPLLEKRETSSFFGRWLDLR